MSKKGYALASPKLASYLDELSKAALIDLVADMLMKQEGGDATDSRLLAAAWEAIHPVAVVRQDRVRAPAQWARHRAEKTREHMRNYPTDGVGRLEERERTATAYEHLATLLEKHGAAT
jgi:hypothetical protein